MLNQVGLYPAVSRIPAARHSPLCAKMLQSPHRWSECAWGRGWTSTRAYPGIEYLPYRPDRTTVSQVKCRTPHDLGFASGKMGREYCHGSIAAEWMIVT